MMVKYINAILMFFLLNSSEAYAMEDRQNVRSVFDKKSVQKNGAELKDQFEKTLEKRSVGLDTNNSNGNKNLQLNIDNTSPQARQITQDMAKGSEDEEEIRQVNELEEFDRVDISDSIFFSDQDIRNLNIIYDAYLQVQKTTKGNERNNEPQGEAGDIISSILTNLKNKKEAEVDEKSETIKREIIFTKLPAYYYLNSILIRNNQATIWVNGLKMSPGQVFNGLEVLKVEKDKVDFLWKVEEKRANFKSWKSRSQANAKFNNNKVEVGIGSRTVSFSLQINQTFDVTNMAIFEGKRIEPALANLGDLYYDPAQYDPSKPDSIITIVKEEYKIPFIDSNEEEVFNKSDQTKEGQEENINKQDINMKDFIKSDEQIIEELKAKGRI